jgi:hypothetical protein
MSGRYYSMDNSTGRFGVCAEYTAKENNFPRVELDGFPVIAVFIIFGLVESTQ